MDGKPCRLTVDSGAEKTLVQPALLDAEWLPDAPQRLCGVTGHCMPLKGPVKARVGVGGAEMELPVYAADVDEECLLGFDYLTERSQHRLRTEADEGARTKCALASGSWLL